MVEIIPVVELEEFTKPTKATNKSAAYDVVAVSRKWTPDYIEYGLGFRTEMPPNIKGIIAPRSSISKYDLAMCNSFGIIDPDYKHEWKVRFNHLTNKAVNLKNQPQDVVDQILDGEKVYKVGERIAQIYFEYIDDLDVSNIRVLENERSGGFGSTDVTEEV